jgi:DUF1365 family protein
MESALYVGTLRHRRFRPIPHEFEYPLFMTMLDIERIPELLRVSPVCSYNRWNWASFDERDHFGDPRRPLRTRLEEEAKASGQALPAGGRVFLLTHLRYLGYNFNPVSFFYCCDSSGVVRTIVAEVNNTFGETRNYWLSDRNRVVDGLARSYKFAKEFHVSPFIGPDCGYRFSFNDPGEALSVHVDVSQQGAPLFDATLTLRRLSWSAANIHRTLIRHPWMTARVIGAIHWQAAKLYLKKTPVVPHPGKGRYRRVNPKHLWPEESK